MSRAVPSLAPLLSSIASLGLLACSSSGVVRTTTTEALLQGAAPTHGGLPGVGEAVLPGEAALVGTGGVGTGPQPGLTREEGASGHVTVDETVGLGVSVALPVGFEIGLRGVAGTAASGSSWALDVDSSELDLGTPWAVSLHGRYSPDLGPPGHITMATELGFAATTVQRVTTTTVEVTEHGETLWSSEDIEGTQGTYGAPFAHTAVAWVLEPHPLWRPWFGAKAGLFPGAIGLLREVETCRNVGTSEESCSVSGDDLEDRFEPVVLVSPMAGVTWTGGYAPVSVQGWALFAWNDAWQPPLVGLRVSVIVPVQRVLEPDPQRWPGEPCTERDLVER